MDKQIAFGNNVWFIGLEFIEHMDDVPHCLYLMTTLFKSPWYCKVCRSLAVWVSGTDRDTLSTLAVTSFPTLSFLPRPEWLRRWNTCGKLCPHIKVQRQIERLLFSRLCWLRKNGPLGAGVEKRFQEGWLWASLIHYTTLMRNRWKTGKKIMAGKAYGFI